MIAISTKMLTTFKSYSFQNSRELVPSQPNKNVLLVTIKFYGHRNNVIQKTDKNKVILIKPVVAANKTVYLRTERKKKVNL